MIGRCALCSEIIRTSAEATMIVGAEGEVARVQALKHDMCVHMQQRHPQMLAQIQANCEIVFRLMAGNFLIETPPEFEKVQQATREAVALLTAPYCVVTQPPAGGKPS